MPRVPDVKTPLTAEQALDAIASAYARLFAHAIDARTLAILATHTALECGQKINADGSRIVGPSMHCYNFGNVKGAHPRTGLYTMFPCDELLIPPLAKAQIKDAPPAEEAWSRATGACGGSSAHLKYIAADGRWCVQFYPPHPQCKFRAFESAEAGAAEQIAFIALDTNPNDGKPNRYAQAWREADAHDDPAAFSHELRKAGYYTAPEEQYTRGIVATFKAWLPLAVAYLERVAQPAQLPLPGQHVTTAPLVPPAPAPEIDRDRVFGLVALTLDESWQRRGRDVIVA